VQGVGCTGDWSTHDLTVAVTPRPIEEGSKPEHAAAADCSMPCVHGLGVVVYGLWFMV